MLCTVLVRGTIGTTGPDLRLYSAVCSTTHLNETRHGCCSVSRSETGQQKALLILNQDWQQTDSIPLDIGPRHLTSSEPCISELALRPGDRS